jgi:hypothetical protein
MSNVRLGAYALALVTLVCAASSPALAAGTTPVRTVVPYAELRENPCTHEVVMLTGETVLMTSTKLSKNGLLEFTVRTKIDGEGTATSVATGLPVSYTFKSDETVKFGDFANGGTEVVVITKSLLVRKGENGEELPSEDDWLMKETLRIKTDSLGTPIIDRTFVNETCPM